MRSLLALSLLFAPVAYAVPQKKVPAPSVLLERISGPVTHVRGKKETQLTGETALRSGDLVRLGGESRAQIQIGEARARLLPGSEIAIGRSSQRSAPWIDLRVGAIEVESPQAQLVKFDSARVSAEVSGGTTIVDHSESIRLSVLSGRALVRSGKAAPLALKAGEMARFSSGLLDGVPEQVGVEQIQAYRKGLGF